MSELKTRLIGRGTETEAQIEKRFATAFEEIKYISDYDYVVVNDIVEVAVNRMEAIITAEKCKSIRNKNLTQSLQGGKIE